MQGNTTSSNIDEQKLYDFMLKAGGDIASTLKFNPSDYWRQTWLIQGNDRIWKAYYIRRISKKD